MTAQRWVAPTLEGRVALVTGASRGLGRTVALALADAGADVVLSSRRAEDLEEVAGLVRDRGRKAEIAEADVRDADSVRRMAERAVDAWGRVDILVNNAGVNVQQYAMEVTEEAWDAVMDTNAKGVYLCSQAIARHMAERGYGRIIQMASQMSLVGYYRRLAYCASKGAVAQMTKVMAIEWAEHGITVNAVAPTFVETPMTRPMFEQDPDFHADVLSRIPLGRLGQPHEVAAAIVFLASEHASLITGHTLPVDGGWTAW